MAATTDAKRHFSKVVSRLRRAYPDAQTALHFQSPVELLVATILSAQCTDERVNQVTRELFKKCHTAADFARLPQAKLERAIQSTGFFRNKAKSIKESCQALVEQYDGEVPKDLDKLVELPGIGRKTASVVLGSAYGIPSGVVVDTHVARVGRRLGLTENKDPNKIEKDLMQGMPKREWIAFSHRMIHHGRICCTARKPKCDECPLADICPKIGVEQT